MHADVDDAGYLDSHIKDLEAVVKELTEENVTLLNEATDLMLQVEAAKQAKQALAKKGDSDRSLIGLSRTAIIFIIGRRYNRD